MPRIPDSLRSAGSHLTFLLATFATSALLFYAVLELGDSSPANPTSGAIWWGLVGVLLYSCISGIVYGHLRAVTAPHSSVDQTPQAFDLSVEFVQLSPGSVEFPAELQPYIDHKLATDPEFAAAYHRALHAGLTDPTGSTPTGDTPQ